MRRREDNKARKREKLETEGLKLFLEHGYDRASIEQVVAAADVARGTFYLYFPDKLALFETLIDRWFTPMIAIFEEVDQQLETAIDRTASLMIYSVMAQKFMLTAAEHRDELLLFFREVRRAGEAGDRLRARELQVLEASTGITLKASQKGLITVEDPRLAAHIIIGASERLHYEWLIGGNVGEEAFLQQRLMKIFGRMLELPSF